VTGSPSTPPGAPGVTRVPQPGINKPTDIERSDTRRQRGMGRTVCRHAIPRGSLAIDYVSSKECFKSSDSTRVYNAALVVDLAGIPAGMPVLVCADQMIPHGWLRSDTNEEVSQCPREASDKKKGPTVIEIMKAGQ
jgi:hypothetical protein